VVDILQDITLISKTLDYNVRLDESKRWFDKKNSERFRKYILSVNSVDLNEALKNL
jgi:hypothetical protein